MSDYSPFISLVKLYLEKNTLSPGKMNDSEAWKKCSSSICVNEEKLAGGGSWEHKAQGDESGTGWQKWVLLILSLVFCICAKTFHWIRGSPMPSRTTLKPSKRKSWNQFRVFWQLCLSRRLELPKGPGCSGKTTVPQAQGATEAAGQQLHPVRCMTLFPSLKPRKYWWPWEEITEK